MQLRLRTILLILAFVAIGFLIYGWSLGNPFVRWDDGMLIYENAAIRGITPATITWIFTHFDPELYIPLTFFTYQIDYLIGGINPFMYHLDNLLLHIFNAFFVFVLCERIFRRRWLALFCGVLFLVHPLNTEAVEWASGRKDVLSTLFFLTSIIAYFFSRDRQSKKWYVVSIVLFLCGLLSKVMVLTLPVVLLILDWLDERQWSPRVLLDKVPYVVLSVVFGLVGLLGKEGVVASSSLSDKILMAFKSVTFYITQYVWPLRFSLLYPYTKQIAVTSPDFFIPIFVVLMLLVVIVYTRHRMRLIAAGLLFYFVTVAPTLINFSKGEMDIYFASDRYAYVPQIGLLFVGAALALLIERALASSFAESAIRKTGIVIGGVLLCVLAMLAYRQSLVWQNTRTLFANVIKLYPDASHVAYNNIANMERLEGDIDAAIADYQKAIAIRPAAKTYSNLGAAYRKQKKYPEAIAAYDKALALDPQSPYAHFGLGIVYAEQGQYDRAELEYLKATGFKPDYTDVYANLGALYAAQGRYEDAIVQYKKALDINSLHAVVTYNLAIAESELGDSAAAMRDYERVIMLDPSMIPARFNLGLLKYYAGDTDGAIAQFKAVLQIDPANKAAQSALQQLGESN